MLRMMARNRKRTLAARGVSLPRVSVYTHKAEKNPITCGLSWRYGGGGESQVKEDIAVSTPGVFGLWGLTGGSRGGVGFGG